MVELLSIFKSKRQCTFVLPNQQEVIPGLRGFLFDLGLGFTNPHELEEFARPSDENGEPISTEDADIASLANTVTSFVNHTYVVNLVFGTERVFLLVTTRDDKQDAITSALQSLIAA